MQNRSTPPPPPPHPAVALAYAQIPGDPPLSLVAAWAVHRECLGPDSPESLRRFFGLFCRLMDIPLSSPQPLPGERRAGGGGAADGEGGGAVVASPTASGSLAPSDSYLWETSDSDRGSSGDELEGVGGGSGGGGESGCGSGVGVRCKRREVLALPGGDVRDVRRTLSVVVGRCCDDNIL